MSALTDYLTKPETIAFAVTIAGAIFNWAAKPRTPEDLAAMHPRRAAFHRFVAALFPDPQKAFESAWQFWKSTHDRLPPKQ